MSEWKQDHAVLHRDDEKYVRTLGRILKLTVERNYNNRNVWDARTHGFGGVGIFLKRKFESREGAIAALEKMAERLLREALNELTVKQEATNDHD